MAGRTQFATVPAHSTTDALEQWVQTRLKKEPTAKFPARSSRVAGNAHRGIRQW
jgi:hypothetical protein